MAADDEYLPYLPCNFAQFARFGRHAEGVVVLVPAGTAENHLQTIEAAASVHELKLIVIPISELDFLHSAGMLPGGRHTSHFTYARLLLAEILPQLDDVLYLDVDTMVRGSLDSLLSWDLRHPVGAVQELHHRGARLFGSSRAPYFNAGVLRMSLERLRQERMWDQAQQLMKARNDLTYEDQDVLNLLFINRFDSLPLTYNVFHKLAAKHSDLAVMHDPVIVHFNGPVKPWTPTPGDPASNLPFAREWRREYSAYIGAAAPPASPIAERRVVEHPRTTNRKRRASWYVAARAILPPAVRRKVKTTTARAVDLAIVRLDHIKTKLEPGLTAPSLKPRQEIKTPDASSTATPTPASGQADAQSGGPADSAP